MKKLVMAVAAVAAALGARAADALPEGYTALEYVKATGAQWIDTEYQPQATDRFESKFLVPELTGNMALYCSRGTDTKTNTYTGFIVKDNWDFRCDRDTDTDHHVGKITAGAPVTVIVDGLLSTCTVNNVSGQMGGGTSFTPGSTLILFASHTKGATKVKDSDLSNRATFNLYFFKVTDASGQVQVDLVPCQDASGVVGLYDLQRGRFFPSAGTQPFFSGAAVAPTGVVPASNYVQEGLVAMWDGLENVGAGLHQDAATNWVNIAAERRGGDLALSPGDFFTSSALHLTSGTQGDYETGLLNLEEMTLEFVIKRTDGTTSIHRFTCPAEYSTTGKAYDTTFESWSNEEEGLLERIGETRLLTVKPVNGTRYTLQTRYDVGSTHHAQTSAGGTTKRVSDSQTNNRKIPPRLRFFENDKDLHVYAVRVYNRRLTDDELAHNRDLDTARFDERKATLSDVQFSGYISSTGTQIFETDYHMDKDSRFEIDFAFTAVEQQARICGNDKIESVFRTSIYANGSNPSKFAFSGGDGWLAKTFVNTDTKRHTGIFDAPKKEFAFVTGTTTNTAGCGQAVTKTATYPLTLFARWTSTSYDAIDNAAKARIYACRIYKKINGTYVLQRDYVPAVSNRQVAGFYERVSGTFSTGKTPQPFGWGGGVMNVGDEPCLVGRGCKNQFVNTGYLVNPSSRIEVDFAVDNVERQSRIFGAYRTDNPCRSVLYLSNGDKYSVQCGSTTTATASSIPIGTVRRTAILDLPANTMTYLLNGVTTETDTLKAKVDTTATDPLALFASCEAVTGFNGAYFTAMHLYGARISEKGEDGEYRLVHDFQPYVRHGVAGLRDRVTGRFVASEGLIPFEARGAVESDGISPDGYIESSGSQMIDSGYKVTPTTRIEWDGNFLMSTPERGTLFGVEYFTGMNVRYYLNGSLLWGWVMEDFASGEPHWTTTASKLQRDPLAVRRLNVLDVKNSRMYVVTGGFTNIVEDTSKYKPYANTSAGTLGLFGLHQKPTTSWTMNAHARLYGLRIYEDDAEGRETLVRDFVPFVSNSVPGVLDRVTGAFRAERTKTGAPFLCGGAIESDAMSTDASLEATGVQGVPVDYFVNGKKTKVEVDFQLSSGNANQTRLFGNSLNKDGCDFNCSVYLNSNGYFTYATGDSFKGDTTSLSSDCLRYRFVIDLPNTKGHFYNPDGSLRKTTALAGTSYTKTCGHMFGVFGDCTSADGTTFRYLAKEKIYSVRLTENGETKCRLVPGCVGGVNGLYDTETGAFYTDSLGSGVPLKLSGAGIDGAGPSFLVQPKAGHMPRTGGKTLKAFAAGATSYQWYRNGEPIEGATLNSYEIPGEGYRETSKFAVKAFFTVNGEPVELLSDEVGVTPPCGVVILVR